VQAEGHFPERTHPLKMLRGIHLEENKSIVAERNWRFATFFLFREGKIEPKGKNLPGDADPDSVE
jgi:hypothetical protein